MPTSNEKQNKKIEKEINKDIKTRQGLFSRNPLNKISKNQKNFSKMVLKKLFPWPMH